jgi:hypothetical protein
VPPPPPVDEMVPAGAAAPAINAILASPGADVVGFEGDEYSLAAPLKPRDGQTLVGPVLFDFGRRCSFGMQLREQVEGVTLRKVSMRSVLRACLQLGHHTTVIGGSFSDAGWQGIAGNFARRSAHVLLRNVELTGNGWDPASWGRGAAGIKVFLTGPKVGAEPGSGVVIDGGRSHHNEGNGYWFDHDCAGDIVRGVEADHCSRKGVFEEVGAGPFLLEDSFVHDNAHAGFQTTNTPRGALRRNRFKRSGIGLAIALLTVDRDDHGGPFEDWRVEDNVLGGDRIRDTSSSGSVVWRRNA